MPAAVYSDRVVWLVFEERPVRVVKVNSDWARCIGARTSPTEKVLLTAFDEAVRGRRYATGLVLDTIEYKSVRSAMAALLQDHKASYAHTNAVWTPAQHVVLELHDSQDVSLPVYGDILPDVQTAIESSPGATDRIETMSIGSVIVAL